MDLIIRTIVRCHPDIFTRCPPYLVIILCDAAKKKELSQGVILIKLGAHRFVPQNLIPLPLYQMRTRSGEFSKTCESPAAVGELNSFDCNSSSLSSKLTS